MVFRNELKFQESLQKLDLSEIRIHDHCNLFRRYLHNVRALFQMVTRASQQKQLDNLFIRAVLYITRTRSILNTTLMPNKQQNIYLKYTYISEVYQYIKSFITKRQL